MCFVVGDHRDDLHFLNAPDGPDWAMRIATFIQVRVSKCSYFSLPLPPSNTSPLCPHGWEKEDQGDQEKEGIFP